MSRMSINAGSKPEGDAPGGAWGFSRACSPFTGEPLGEVVTGHLVDAERGEQLAEHTVGREVTVFELVVEGNDLLVDDGSDRVAQHLVFVGPVEHRSPFSRR